jgi:hypothetical protein
MVAQADAFYETQWLKGTTLKFQSEGFITKGLGLAPVSVAANEVKWRLAGAGTAATLVRGAHEVVPMNAAREIVTGTMTAKQAAEYIDGVDVNRMSENEKDIVNKTCAMALGRARDGLFVDALAAGATALNSSVGAFADKLTLGTVIAAKAALEKRLKRASQYQIFGLFTSNPWNQLLTFPEFSNSQWIGTDLPFAKMTDRRSWNGMYLMQVPDDMLPLVSTDDRTCFLFAREAIGEAEASSVTGHVSWENTKTAWLHNMWMDMCVKCLQPEGVQDIKCDDDAAISTMSSQLLDALAS